MLDDIRQLILQEKYVLRENLQVPTVKVAGATQGIELAKTILYEIVSRNTVLYLSGGRTPKELYKVLAKEEKIYPGVVGLVDERYGKPHHENSNELMLRESGLLRYFQMLDIPFVPILGSRPHPFADDKDPLLTREGREVASQLYDQKVRELFATYQRHVAILGIGMDGHTGGIPSDLGVWEEYHLASRMKTEMVVDYDDHGKFYNERITMSFLALSMMDVLIVLVFGKDKKRALEWMMADGPEEEVPSRFFKRPDIATKVILITDCNISF